MYIYNTTTNTLKLQANTRSNTFYLATIHRTTTTNSYANISTIFVLHSTYSTYCTKNNNKKFKLFQTLRTPHNIWPKLHVNIHTLTYAIRNKYKIHKNVENIRSWPQNSQEVSI